MMSVILTTLTLNLLENKHEKFAPETSLSQSKNKGNSNLTSKELVTTVNKTGILRICAIISGLAEIKDENTRLRTFSYFHIHHQVLQPITYKHASFFY